MRILIIIPWEVWKIIKWKRIGKDGNRMMTDVEE